MEYLYQQAGRQLVIPEDNTLKDDEIMNEMDEGFVDESTALSSISEHPLTVGVGGNDEEAEEKDEEKEEEPEGEVHMSNTYI